MRMSDQESAPTEIERETLTPPAGEDETETERETTEERVYTRAEVQAIKREAQALRTRLRAAEDEAKNHRTTAETTRSEIDTLRTQHAEATDLLRSYRLRDAIAQACDADEALRGTNPELVALLITVEYGEDGKPKALKEAIKAVLARYPELAPRPRVPQQSRAGGNATGSIIETYIQQSNAQREARENPLHRAK
jgi:hypothetical protein